MIKVFYIEDNNGQYVSADGSKRWTRLTGQALYDFLQTERGKKTYFFVDTDDNGVAIGVDDAAAPAADIALDGQGALKFHTTGKDAAVPDGILESSAVKVSVAAVDGHIVVCTAPEIGKGAADGGAGHTDIGIESFLIT